MEEFAVTLRKKKHSEILMSKRKANMNKAFLLTTSPSDPIEASTSIIRTEEALN